MCLREQRAPRGFVVRSAGNEIESNAALRDPCCYQRLADLHNVLVGNLIKVGIVGFQFSDA